MGYVREDLNRAVSQKLQDIDDASLMHKILFFSTQVGGVFLAGGAVLLLPLALETGAISLAGGLAMYGISQLMQSKRVGHFLPLPGVPVSGGQLGYVVSRLAASLTQSNAPAPPDEVKLLPVDWLPEKEKRVNYLLTHCPDVLITAAETAQDGISFAAIVDTAVRASEYAITDEQLSDPVMGLKLAGEVRKVLTGDTSVIEAQQTKAIAQQWQQAKIEHQAGRLNDDELAAVESHVRVIAPGALVCDEFFEPARSEVGETTGLDAVDVEAISQPEPPALSRADLFALLNFPLTLFWGGQGSGKTSAAVFCAFEAAQRGWQLAIADPDFRLGDWPGLPVTGKGGNYAECDQLLSSAMAECDRRYVERAEQGTDTHQFQPVLFILEEFTDWSEECDHSAAFIKKVLQKFRKVNMHVLLISHGETLAALGGAKGFAKTFNRGSIKLHLLAKKTQVGQKLLPRPTGFAELSELGVEQGTVAVPSFKNWRSPTGVTVKAFSQQPTAKRQAELLTEAHHTPTETMSVSSRWDKFRTQCVAYPHLVAMADWLERREGKTFTLKQLKDDKKLRSLFREVKRGAPEGLLTFNHYGFTARVDASTFQVLPQTDTCD